MMTAAGGAEHRRRDGPVFECPVNAEVRQANIDGAQAWEDLDDKALIREKGWTVEAFSRKAISSKGWG